MKTVLLQLLHYIFNNNLFQTLPEGGKIGVDPFLMSGGKTGARLKYDSFLRTYLIIWLQL